MCFLVEDLDADVKTLFVISGFSSFADVPVNPTQVVVSKLEAYLGKRFAPRGLPGGAEVDSCTVLRVAAKVVQQWLRQQAARLEHDAPARVVFLMFGVDVTAPCHKLEAQAYNLADFRVPDEDGWQPHDLPIDRRQPPTHTLKTRLPIDRLSGALRSEGHRLEVSFDAGRFVCNWTYYCSLALCQQRPSSEDPAWYSLFVHSPAFSVCPEEEQLRFAAALVEQIALVFAGPEPPPEPSSSSKPGLDSATAEDPALGKLLEQVSLRDPKQAFAVSRKA